LDNFLLVGITDPSLRKENRFLDSPLVSPAKAQRKVNDGGKH
jgi:hypothetical protein